MILLKPRLKSFSKPEKKKTGKIYKLSIGFIRKIQHKEHNIISDKQTTPWLQKPSYRQLWILLMWAEEEGACYPWIKLYQKLFSLFVQFFRDLRFFLAILILNTYHMDSLRAQHLPTILQQKAKPPTRAAHPSFPRPFPITKSKNNSLIVTSKICNKLWIVHQFVITFIISFCLAHRQWKLSQVESI